MTCVGTGWSSPDTYSISWLHRGCGTFGCRFAPKPWDSPSTVSRKVLGRSLVKVTGSLFHTQGSLEADGLARVLREDGSPLPNLFAGGGAACGVSGPADWGYLTPS